MHLAKPGQHLISFHARLFSGDGNKLNKGHVECHIMTKKSTTAGSSLQFVWGFLNYYYLTNIPICPLRSMSYKDTRQELQKGPFWQSQFKFHKHIVAFPSRGERAPRPSFLHQATSPLTKDGAKFPREK